MFYRYFLIVFLGIATSAYSQSSGYLGKRLLLSYGFHTSPAFLGANGQNKTIIGRGGSAETGTFALNAIHEGALELTLSSKWLMCFSTRYYKTVYDNAAQFDGAYTTGSYYSGSRSTSILDDRPNGYYNLRGLTYTLYFKYYGKRYVAPWGRYVMFGPTLNTVKTTYDPAIMNVKARAYNSYSSSYTESLVSDFGPRENKFLGANLMLGFGRNRIIGNRVTIDYGCNLQLFSIVSGVATFVFGDDEFLALTAISTSNYIENTAKKRMNGVNRFNVFLKVGILLF